MSEQPTIEPTSEISRDLVLETTNLFLGLSWVFQQHSSKITKAAQSEKRIICFAPLDTSLGLSSADVIHDSSLTTYKLCTQVLRIIGGYQKYPESDMYMHSKILSPELKGCIGDRNFNDLHPLVLAVLNEFSALYECKIAHRDPYWKIKNNKYGHRAAQSYTRMQGLVWALSILLWEKHTLYLQRSIRSGMGLISVYE